MAKTKKTPLPDISRTYDIYSIVYTIDIYLVSYSIVYTIDIHLVSNGVAF